MAAVTKSERGRPSPTRRSAAPGRSSARPLSLGQARSPALLVGAANDPAEHEADVAADRVSRGLPAGIGAVDCGATGSTAASPPTRRDDQPDLDSLDAPVSVSGPEQDVTVAAAQNVDLNGLDADDTAEIENGEPAVLRAGSDPATLAQVGREGGAAPADVAARIAAPSGGAPLPGPVRSHMEAAFGHDFGAVRLHADAADRADAARLGARAFTTGADIWLGPGERPDDVRLIAHELAHVIQARAAPAGPGADGAVHRLALADLAPLPIPDRLLREVEDFMANVPGYSLARVALGKDPISGRDVPRTAENIVRGVLGMVPVLGEQLFQQLRETHAIAEASDWINERLQRYDLTGERVIRTLRRAAEAFELLSPVESVRGVMAPLLADFFGFAGEAKDKILELIVKAALAIAGPYGTRIWAIIERARESLNLIYEDPLRFAQNLIRAVMQGFGKFSDRIGEHLKRGLMGWLFGALGGAGLEIPARLDLRGLISLGLQVVGLTWARWRERLARRLDPAGLRKIQILEAGVDVLKILATEGFAGIWRKLLEMVDNFRQIVIGGIKTFVTETIIRSGIGWLAGLANPIGGIVRIAKAIYDMIKVFLERLEQIFDVAESLFDAIGAIARGSIGQAADRVEETMSRGVPVVIAFIAGLLGLSGIGARIRAILDRLRAPIDRALERLMTFLANKARAFLARIIGRINRRREVAEAPFRIGTTQHRIFAERQGAGVVIKVASTPVTLDAARAQLGEEAEKIVDPTAKQAVEATAAEIGEAKTETDTAKRGLNLNAENSNQRRTVEAIGAEVHEAAGELEQCAAPLANATHAVDTAPPDGALLRAREPRLEGIEGATGTYTERGSATAQPVPGRRSRRVSDYVQNDHLIGKVWHQQIVGALADKSLAAPRTPGAISTRARAMGTNPVAAAATTIATTNRRRIGELHQGLEIGENAAGFPAMSIYKAIHVRKNADVAANPPPASVGSAIATAAAAPDPVSALKARIRQQLDIERNFIGREYNGDAAATPRIKADVVAGLNDLAVRTARIYGLGDVAPTTELPSPAATAVPPSDLAFDGSGDTPDFTQNEGLRSRHRDKPRAPGYFENDHLVEKAWPLHAASVRIGAPDIIAPAMSRLGSAGRTPEVENRLRYLRGARLFDDATAVAAYNESNGHSVTLYAPVHHAVTRGADTPPRSPEAVTEALPGDHGEALGRYLRSGAADALAETRSTLRAAISRRAASATREHGEAIDREYANEARAVERINPGRVDDARIKMRAITKTVRRSVSAARAEVPALFA